MILILDDDQKKHISFLTESEPESKQNCPRLSNINEVKYFNQ